MPLSTMKKIIFDNDGVNINSETLAMRICDDWLSEMVAQFSPDKPLAKDYIYSNFAGKSTNKIASLILQETGIPLEAVKETYGFTADQLDQIKKDQNLDGPDAEREAVAFALADLITVATIDGFKEKLEAIYGITKTHEQIRDLFGVGNVYLATTSREDRMEVSLAYAVDPQTGGKARLDEFFQKGIHRLSGYGHKNKYDLLFHRAEEAGEPIDPSAAVVVEDSPSGVEYAKAGRPELRVIGTAAADFFPDKPAHARKLLSKGANVVLTDMRDLPLVVKWLDDDLDPKKMPRGMHGEVFTQKYFDELDAAFPGNIRGRQPSAP